MKTKSSACLNTALRILARRDHSCAELKQKLGVRGFDEGQIAAVVSDCLRLSYLDDSRFALGCLNRLRRRGYGSRRIRQVLQTKGVSGSLIEDIFEQHYSLPEQHEDCRRAFEKKIQKRTAMPSIRQIHRFLLQRGFPIAIVMDVIQERGFRMDVEASD